MGRELKRVALDFEWPMNKPWSGFLNPHYAKNHQCTACSGSGETIARQRLGDLVSFLMLSGDDAMRGKCHPYLSEAPLFYTQGKTCDKGMVELTSGLAGRTPSYFGHDSCDKWSAKKKIMVAAGVSENWGCCPACNGEGSIWETPEDKQASEAWKPSEPPSGDGYQIWETVSEGSPITPVFATAEELARYASNHPWGGDTGSSYESWLKFISGPGWAPSMIVDANGIHTGADAALTGD